MDGLVQVESDLADGGSCWILSLSSKTQEESNGEANRNGTQQEHWRHSRHAYQPKDHKTNRHDYSRKSRVDLHYSPRTGMWLIVVLHMLILSPIWTESELPNS
jgi:hypothetical protein